MSMVRVVSLPTLTLLRGTPPPPPPTPLPFSSRFGDPEVILADPEPPPPLATPPCLGILKVIYIPCPDTDKQCPGCLWFAPTLTRLPPLAAQLSGKNGLQSGVRSCWEAQLYLPQLLAGQPSSCQFNASDQVHDHEGLPADVLKSPTQVLSFLYFLLYPVFSP